MRSLLPLLLLCLPWVHPAPAQPSSSSSPNIVLVMCDDLGWGDTGFNGNTIVQTPHLDRMAAAGLRFNRFYAAAPVCSPTRGSVLTGRHPYRYGIYFANTGHMKSEEITLAELLRKKGYRTGHFGKWHVGTLTKTVNEANRGGPRGVKHYSPPQDNGFEVCFSTESKVPTWDPMWTPKKHSGGSNRRLWWEPLEDTTNMQRYGTHYWDQEGRQVTKNLRGSNARVIMDRAIPFIESAAKADRAFMAVVWFHTPHLPVVAGPRHAAMYKEFDSYKKHYYGSITAMDEQVGRLRQALKKAGVADNTMLWFCSDNGPEGNDSAPGKTGGFRGRKRSLYEGGIRVPGLLEWPAVVKSGSITDFPATTLDYLPTILGAIGESMPDARPTDGINLRPAIEGKLKERPAGIGLQSSGTAAYITHQYKLVLPGVKKKANKSGTKKPTPELYDLIDDPHEKKNIAASHQSRVNDLMAEFKKWQQSCARSDAGNDYTIPAKADSSATGQPLRFGAIADCQFADIPTRGSRHYRLASEKLSAAVKHLNGEPLDFVIHLGDFIDQDWDSFDAVGPIFRSLKAPGYHLLGNHDYSVKDSRKGEIVEKLGMPARYYDFTVKGWRFIVLDGNELSLYAHPKGSKQLANSVAFRKKYKNPPDYCGGMGQAQIKWMLSRIAMARDAGERVILFNHFPIYPAGRGHNLWNDTELLEVLKPFRGTVAAWINGHNHGGAHAERDGIHYLTLKGMLDTRENAFAIIRAGKDSLEVDGFGREPDRTLKLPKPTATRTGN
jgi:arylsulfatase A-like enzyme/predicted phosphodiesterase